MPQLSSSVIESIPQATHVRSTLLQQSLRALRNRGYFQRWEAYVDPLHGETILAAIAPAWLPIEVGLAHYEACDRLGLDVEEMEQIGEGVGAQLQSTLLGVASKIARSAGVISQDAVSQVFAKLWPRLVQGGRFQTTYRSKEVTIELRSALLTQSQYFRGTFLGNVRAGATLFGRKLRFLRALPYDEANDHYVVQMGYA